MRPRTDDSFTHRARQVSKEPILAPKEALRGGTSPSSSSLPGLSLPTSYPEEIWGLVEVLLGAMEHNAVLREQVVSPLPLPALISPVHPDGVLPGMFLFPGTSALSLPF